jgi:hypothetical protein
VHVVNKKDHDAYVYHRVLVMYDAKEAVESFRSKCKRQV